MDQKEKIIVRWKINFKYISNYIAFKLTKYSM